MGDKPHLFSAAVLATVLWMVCTALLGFVAAVFGVHAAVGICLCCVFYNSTRLDRYHSINYQIQKCPRRWLVDLVTSLVLVKVGVCPFGPSCFDTILLSVEVISWSLPHSTWYCFFSSYRWRWCGWLPLWFICHCSNKIWYIWKRSPFKNSISHGSEEQFLIKHLDKFNVG